MEKLIEPKLLKVKDVALLLNMAESTVYEYIYTGILPALLLPPVRPPKGTKRNKHAYRFKVEDIHRFIDNLSGWSLPSNEEVLNGSH